MKFTLAAFSTLVVLAGIASAAPIDTSVLAEREAEPFNGCFEGSCKRSEVAERQPEPEPFNGCFEGSCKRSEVVEREAEPFNGCFEGRC